MFTSFHIERFRGIPALDIDGVKPITLLVGKNNSGKTSVLEAIFLLCGGTEPISAVKIANQRGQRIANASDAETARRSLFEGMNSGTPIKISGYFCHAWEELNGDQELEIKAIEERSYSVDPVSPFSGVAEAGGKRHLRGLELICQSHEIADHVGTEADQRIATH